MIRESGSLFDTRILQLEHDLTSRNTPFLGIPILKEVNDATEYLAIGHNFFNIQERYIFSYDLKKSRYVNLPRFTFCTFTFLDDFTTDAFKWFPFKFRPFPISKKPFIDLDERFASQLSPRHVSLYLSEENDRYIWQATLVKSQPYIRVAQPTGIRCKQQRRWGSAVFSAVP